MSRLHSIPDRALELAHSVSANLKDAMPHAGDWIKTGAALGAVRGGARVAGGLVRRHPVALAAAVVGAGALWYWARKRAQRAQDAHEGEAIEGRSRRVDARRTGARRRSATQTHADYATKPNGGERAESPSASS